MKRATKKNHYSRNADSISIHALVKRATNFILAYYGQKVISIHALVKRATTVYSIGGDDMAKISIHALVKRATSDLQHHFLW